MKTKIKKTISNLINYIKYLINWLKMRKVKRYFDFPEIADIDETIDKIIHNRCSVSRFGDNEIKLMIGSEVPELFFQKEDNSLTNMLIKVHQSNLENHIVCLPYIFEEMYQYNYSARKFWTGFLVKHFKVWVKYISPCRKYYNSFITRPYMDLKDKSKSSYYFNNLKKIWDNREIVIVEGEGSRLGVGNDLFKNSLNIERIICPSRDAYDIYDEIVTSTIKMDNNKLILIALGPAATILAYDLHLQGYQAIDIGHVDIEYEWYLKKSKKKIKIDNKYTNEVHDGRIVESIDDLEYKNQTIINLCKIHIDKSKELNLMK